MRRPENGELVVLLAPERDDGRAWKLIGIVNEVDAESEQDAEDAVAEIARRWWLSQPKRQIAVVRWEVREPPPYP